jgi:hypothetical protein
MAILLIVTPLLFFSASTVYEVNKFLGEGIDQDKLGGLRSIATMCS